MKRFLIYARSNIDNSIIDKIKDTIETLGAKSKVLIVTEADEDIDIEEDIDAIISVGGDGTLVSAAKAAKSLSAPIVGVNLGHMGYLCDLDMDSMEEGIRSLVNGDFGVEERMMLSGYLGGEKKLRSALNDIVISKGHNLM